jgi:hypothetical protein
VSLPGGGQNANGGSGQARTALEDLGRHVVEARLELLQQVLYLRTLSPLYHTGGNGAGRTNAVSSCGLEMSPGLIAGPAGGAACVGVVAVSGLADRAPRCGVVTFRGSADGIAVREGKEECVAQALT